MVATVLGSELKKGTSEVLILSILENRPRHGYEIAKLIEQRSGGLVDFHVASLYPMLYRLERRGWIEGKWVEKAGQRRRRPRPTAGRRGGVDGAEGFAGTAAELAGIDSGDGEGGVVWKLGTLHGLIQKLRWADRLGSG